MHNYVNRHDNIRFDKIEERLDRIEEKIRNGLSLSEIESIRKIIVNNISFGPIDHELTIEEIKANTDRLLEGLDRSSKYGKES